MQPIVGIGKVTSIIKSSKPQAVQGQRRAESPEARPHFEGQKTVFRLRPEVSRQLTHYLYPMRSWLPYQPTPTALQPYTPYTWVGYGDFFDAADRHHANTIHQGIVTFLWKNSFEGFPAARITLNDKFHPLFESLLLEKLGMLKQMNPTVEPQKLRISNQSQTVLVLDDNSPHLHKLFKDIHDDYREYLKQNPEYTSNFNLHVVNNEIWADKIRPNLWG